MTTRTPSAQDFLMEIGVEELPVRMVLSAYEQLQQQVPAALDAARVTYGSVQAFATPRRIGVIISRLAPKQTASTQEVTGPAQRVAFDAHGKPTKACTGFLKRYAARVQDLTIDHSSRGAYVVLRRTLPSQSTAMVMKAVLPAIIQGLHFKKTMRWQHAGGETFPRPIRWLVALYGRQVVPFRYGQLKAGRMTCTHRGAGSKRLAIPTASRYLVIMERQRIILDPVERRAATARALAGQFTPAERKRGLRLAAETTATTAGELSLLDEVAHLVEQPVAFRGVVDKKLCILPREILIASMAKYQRVFAVADRRGKLQPCFLAVTNGQPAKRCLVRAVFEHILAARLSDSVMFFTKDRAIDMQEFVAQLRGIQVHRQLGTMYEKSQRMKALATAIATAWGLSDVEQQQAATAAELSKADLVSRVVFEFPSLQGIMGGIYYQAIHGQSGVSQAIQDHYLTTQPIPRSIIGIIVAIADRLDNLVGFTGVGIRATGSADPFGLRRAANELLQLLAHESSHELNLSEILDISIQLWHNTLEKSPAEIRTETHAYLQERFETRQEARYDLVRAVMAVRFDDVGEAMQRIRALEACMAGDPELFAQACQVAERTRNIVKAAGIAGDTTPNPELYSEAAERQLWSAVQETQPRIEKAISQRDYTAALREYAQTFTELLAAFFEQVMVNVDDRNVRKNRLVLLRHVDLIISQSVADLTQVVVTAPGSLHREAVVT